jgi:hypothetical protein
LDRADTLAAELVEEVPELAIPARLRPLALSGRPDGPALHLDDLSAIARPNWAKTIDYMQDRARLRAGDGDFIATAHPPVPGFNEYCTEQLGLGNATWLVPESTAGALALSCLHDRRVKRALVSAARSDRLAYVHPHLASGSVWQLAAELAQASRRPLQVVGPPPGVCAWANDKLHFARAASRLLGPSFVPRTEDACNLAALAQRAQGLGRRARFLAIKIPDSAGGGGNYVVEAARIRGRSLQEVGRVLRKLLPRAPWQQSDRLLVGCWETDVLAAPSAQLWLPSIDDGPPLVEGVFLQDVAGEAGVFSGTRPADLEPALLNDIALRSWLLGRLFQRLGYVGRCSFDTILVGRTAASARVKFIECNGRWGGTSLPMTLVNRLRGDWRASPFAVRDVRLPGLERAGFSQLVEQLAGRLYDCRTGHGHLVIYGARRLIATGTLAILAWGTTPQAAQQRLRWPQQRLRRLVRKSIARD